MRPRSPTQVQGGFPLRNGVLPPSMAVAMCRSESADVRRNRISPILPNGVEGRGRGTASHFAWMACVRIRRSMCFLDRLFFRSPARPMFRHSWETRRAGDGANKKSRVAGMRLNGVRGAGRRNGHTEHAECCTRGVGERQEMPVDNLHRSVRPCHEAPFPARECGTPLLLCSAQGAP
jgi:hypothetical protein